jgi:hypothetical protein
MRDQANSQDLGISHQVPAVQHASLAILSTPPCPQQGYILTILDF